MFQAKKCASVAMTTATRGLVHIAHSTCTICAAAVKVVTVQLALTTNPCKYIGKKGDTLI
jgi:hypothetical protein